MNMMLQLTLSILYAIEAYELVESHAILIGAATKKTELSEVSLADMER